MEWGGAEAGQRGHVLRAAVALVAGEAVAGILAVQLDEEPVAVDFRQDACCRDGEAAGVALDDGLLWAGPVDLIAAVDEEIVGGEGELLDGEAHGEERGLADVDAVDGCGVDGGDGEGYGFQADFGIELVALLFGELLGVGEAGEAAAFGQDDCGGYDGAEERAAANFVQAGDLEKAGLASGVFQRDSADGGAGHGISIRPAAVALAVRAVARGGARRSLLRRVAVVGFIVPSVPTAAGGPGNPRRGLERSSGQITSQKWGDRWRRVDYFFSEATLTPSRFSPCKNGGSASDASMP